jgi:sulfatase modifying factor 1
MRLSSALSLGLLFAVACSVDYRSDEAEYNRRLCALSDAACVSMGGAPADGGDAASGGFFGTGGFEGTGGFPTGGSYAGGTAGVGGSIQTGGFGGSGGTGPCVIGTQVCKGATVASCPSGTWVSSLCQGTTPACEAGQCVTCVNGSGRCAGTTPQLCVANAWQPETPCGANTICQAGHCVTPPSCVGLPATCGSTGDQDCCSSLVVPGGTYYHNNTGTEPATISDFLLDRYEITVGRFRKFVAAYATYRPPAGAGADPKIPGSGWDSSWTPTLPVTAGLLAAALACNTYATWTDTAGTQETRPINCLDWYSAFAFCAWDGGRLPTDTEWNYAASGGTEQRIYPWGNTAPAFDATQAIYDCLYKGTGGSCSNASIAPVGSAPAGNGKWGHADLVGNVEEWMLDANYGTYPEPCNDCGYPSTGTTLRGLRGGYFSAQASSLVTSTPNSGSASTRGSTYGARCARTP